MASCRDVRLIAGKKEAGWNEEKDDDGRRMQGSKGQAAAVDKPWTGAGGEDGQVGRMGNRRARGGQRSAARARSGLARYEGVHG